MRLKDYKEPWRATLQGIKDRLKKKNTAYYRKGIKCLITAEEIKILWFRDKAYSMKKPSIDRKNSRKNYTFKNCRYLEFIKNCGAVELTSELRKLRSINTTKFLKEQWKNPVYRKKMSNVTKKLWKNLKYRKEKIKEIKMRMITSWKDPVYRAKRKKKYNKRRKNECILSA